MKATIIALCALLAGCDVEEPKATDKTPYLVPYEAYKLRHSYVVEFYTTRGDFCVSSSNGLTCDWSKDK